MFGPSFADNELREGYDTSSFVMQASPQKSFFQNMRDKSLLRSNSKSRSRRGDDAQDRSGINKSTANMVEKLSQMSKSRSRSRSGNAGANRGRQQGYQGLEKEVSKVIENKSNALK